MECEALGLMGVRECYIMDKGNSSVMSWVRTQRGQRGLDANEQYWEANLKGTEATSIEKCKGRGVWAPAKPPQGAAGAGARRSCLCYAGFGGPSCERSTLARERRNCLNECSGRGACVRNWCHCDAGFYGVDCSLGVTSFVTALLIVLAATFATSSTSTEISEDVESDSTSRVGLGRGSAGSCTARKAEGSSDERAGAREPLCTCAGLAAAKM